MQKLNETLQCLSSLSDRINSHYLYYSEIEKENLRDEYSSLVDFMMRQNQKLLDKLLLEYKRLSKKSYTPGDDNNFEDPFDLSVPELLEECYKKESELIKFYSDIINRDILWEVLPVLAKQLNQVRISADILDDFNRESRKQKENKKIGYIVKPSQTGSEKRIHS